MWYNKMTDLKIIEEKPISISQLKEELKDIKKRDEELTFRSAKVNEQLESLKILKVKEVEEIYEKIEKLNIPRLKEAHILKIIDLLPANISDLKNITQGYGLAITNENLEKMLNKLEDYLPKKK
jgi:DNA-directed RNA polymerase subunit F